MANRPHLPRLALAARPTLQPLPADSATPDREPQPDALHDVPADGHPVVPERLGPTGPSGAGSPPADLHVALVISDLKQWEAIRASAYLISPPYWQGNVQLHVIWRNPKQTPEEMLYRIALADLGLADPNVLGLMPDEHLTLGWRTDPDE